MRILSPLSKIEEVEPLILAGADEFYCGLMNKGGILNDRQNTAKYNFETAAELSRAVYLAHKKGKKIFLALNAKAVNIKEAFSHVHIAYRLKIDGLILSNPLLMKKVKSTHPELELDSSCLCAVFNSRSVNYFKKFGIKRFHLPRQLGLDQLKSIRDNVSGVRLSVFGMRGMCVNIEAFCLLHNIKKAFLIHCRDFKTLLVKGESGISKEYVDKKIKMPPFSCSLCALRRLKSIGIESVKVEGRGADIQSKIKFVSAVKKALSGMGHYHNDASYGKFCKIIFKEYFNEPCRQEYCYF